MNTKVPTPILGEMVEYYRARAAEYDEWFYRRGRYDRGAAANAQWDKAPGFYQILTDQPGKESWPITGATFILVYRNQTSPANGAQVLKFFEWGYNKGDGLASSLDYVPLPANVKTLLKKQWARSVTAGGKPVYVAK